MRSDAHAFRDRHGRGLRPQAGLLLPVRAHVDVFHKEVHDCLANLATQRPTALRGITVNIEFVPTAIDIELSEGEIPLWRSVGENRGACTLFRKPIEQIAQTHGLGAAVRLALTGALAERLGVDLKRINPEGIDLEGHAPDRLDFKTLIRGAWTRS